MAVALGVLRLEPRVFWAMTLRELAAALRVLEPEGGVGTPMDRVSLAGLMARYPDRNACK